MNKIVVQYSSRFDTHELTEWTNKSLGMFGLFLTDMLKYHFPAYIEWALNPLELKLEGNSTVLRKNESNICIGSLFSDEPDNGPFFNISISEFINSLKLWKKILDLKPKQIIITEENGVVTIEPSLN